MSTNDMHDGDTTIMSEKVPLRIFVADLEASQMIG
jgi:hypothetical protein